MENRDYVSLPNNGKACFLSSVTKVQVLLLYCNLSHMGGSPGPLCLPLWALGLGGLAQENNDTGVTGVLYSPPTSIEMLQDKFLACKEGKIS